MRTSATPLSLESHVDGNVSITCTAEGVPGPNVTWGRANGRPLPPDRSSSPKAVKVSEIETVSSTHRTHLVGHVMLYINLHFIYSSNVFMEIFFSVKILMLTQIIGVRFVFALSTVLNATTKP